jgi:carboxymethylenebutenolidase
MTPQEQATLWATHLQAEFETKDLETLMATVTDDVENRNMPMGPGVRGYAAVQTYYRDIFIPSWPDDLQTKLVNRIMGEDQLVDELHMVFTHDRAMEWLLPGVAPTHRTIEMDVVAVVQFRDGKLAGERIYWDQAAVLRQVGLLQQ